MGKYDHDAAELLRLIGGKENIAAVTHCMTRMRFALVDPKKADIKKIEELKSVLGSFTNSGQFQVIIGNDVATFYQDFSRISGVDGGSKDDVKKAAKSNQNLLQRIVGILAEIFAPLIPAIVTGGLILGFRNCIDSLYIFKGGHTLVELSQFWSGVDSFLWLIGEAIFHMLPVGICWSVVRKMKGTEILGIILGLTLCSGQLLNAYAVATTAAADIPKWDFGFFKMNMIGYQAQVIPAMLAAFTLVYLERLFKKITPQVVSMIVVPFFSLVLSVIAAHAVLGPIGWKIGSVISAVVYAGITGPAKILFGAVFGFLYAPLVITGLHHMSNAIDLQLISDFKGTMLWPMIALSNIAQGSAVVAMAVLQKKNTRAQEVNVPSAISCYLGVTEPAMYGVNLKYRFPFVCALIGSALAAVISVMTGTTANAIGVGGLPGILSIKTNFIPTFALAMAVALVVPFVLTLLLGMKKLSREDRGLAAEAPTVNVQEKSVPQMDNESLNTKRETEETVLFSVTDGEIISLEDVNDGVFSAKVMGDGFAVEPASDTVVSPADAEVAVMMEETKHAVGLKLAGGAELLIHVGLDTVDMGGDGFEYMVKAGDHVKTGEPLIRFDKAKIEAAGHRAVTMVIVTDAAGRTLTVDNKGEAKAGVTQAARLS